MDKAINFQLIITNWPELHMVAKQIRHKVFFEEQGVSEHLLTDEFDPECIHVGVYVDKHILIASARMDKEGKVGRMAVLPAYRDQKIGMKMLNSLIQKAKEMKFKKIYCHAQKQVVGFYEKAGFQCEGSEFMEAGLSHVKMIKQLF